MSEIWKEIKIAPNYEVSDLGRVRNKKTGHILNPQKGGGGYLRVSMWCNGGYVREYIHRLVGFAFIPNPDNLPCVNHMDENRFNNCKNNLEWCTYKYNAHYSFIWEKSAPIAHETRKKPIIQLTKEGKYVNEYDSGVDASKQTGINVRSIYMCCGDKRKSAGGYVWRYK